MLFITKDDITNFKIIETLIIIFTVLNVLLSQSKNIIHKIEESSQKDVILEENRWNIMFIYIFKF